MKLTKRLVLGVATAASIAMGVSAARADLVFATDAAPYPPFTSQNAAGEWEGWEYELLQALCAEMNEKCTLIPIAWDGIIPALLEKKMDGIFGSMSITDERKKQINFTSVYYNSAAVLIGPKGGDKNIAPDALKGKTIGAQASTTHANYVEKYFVAAGATLKTYKGQDEANADLAAGRVDYVQADGVTLNSFLQSDDGKACCELYGAVPLDVEVLGPGVGAAIRKEDTALLEKINGAIKSYAAKGGFEELAKKHGLSGLLILPPNI
ncbi:MAG: transporter substrate-binding domain-containing protein [Rhizobiales bacterium]|nr:transporter substrate-binding domain-containing protein [Hyphomicrobiales bacterium]